MSNKIFVVCECGKRTSTNLLRRHIAVCSASSEFKSRVLELVSLREKNKVAWRVSLGEDALGDPSWWTSVLYKETDFKDWSFVPPRNPGQMTPNARKKMGMERRGRNNPACKRDYSYTEEDVSFFVKSLFRNKELMISDIRKLTSASFPDWAYLFADLEVKKSEIRGANKQNLVLAHILGVPIEKITKERAIRRGIKIREGQQNSGFRSFSSFIAANLRSSVRVSRIHLVLYEMILSVDPSATIEKVVRDGDRFKAYDIFSPQKNALIEVHGDSWHKITPGKNEGLHDLVLENIKNDEEKEALAASLGFEYFVFWESERTKWRKQIFDIYGKESVTYDRATHIVNQKSWKEKSL